MAFIRSAACLAILALGAAAAPCEPTDTPDPTETPDRPSPTPPWATATAAAMTPTPGDGPFAVVTYGGLKEATNQRCSDGIDNDGNGFADCEDYGCRYTTSVSVCGVEHSTESTNSRCANGSDDDGNGYADCADYACLWNADVTVCDRDGDGVKPRDGDCFDHPNIPISEVVHPGVPEMCGDREDNDCDGTAEEVQCIQLYLGYRTVSYTLDGDTIQVASLGRARLLGVDTPEYSDSEVECYGLEAKQYTESKLADTSVQVWVDPYSWETDFKDIYDRWLLHIYREDGTYHNADLVQGGFGCAYGGSYFQHTQTELLLSLEDEAQAAGAGLWTACAPNASRVCF